MKRATQHELYVFEGSRFITDGPVEFKFIDYSKELQSERHIASDTDIVVHKALSQAGEHSIAGKHTGALVVVADIFGNNGILPLAEILNEIRPNLGRVYAEDPEALGSLFLDISDKDNPHHDGAIIIDDQTSRVLDANVHLIPPPFMNGNHREPHYRGTRHRTAATYSRISVVRYVGCIGHGKDSLVAFRNGEPL